MNNLHIHGDNIVECERVLDLILQSFGDQIECFALTNASVVCPSFSLKLKNDDTAKTITFFRDLAARKKIFFAQFMKGVAF